MKNKLIGFVAALLILPSIVTAGYYGWPTTWDFASLKISGAAVESAADSHSYADTGDASTLTSAQGYADAKDSLKANLSGATFNGDVTFAAQPIAYRESNAGARFVMLQSNGTADENRADILMQNDILYGRFYDDAVIAQNNWLSVTRNGHVPADITLSGTGELRFNGYHVWHQINDGAGSGLDADYIDGRTTATIWGSDNDGAGSGLDADYIDGRTTATIWGSDNDGAGSGLDADTVRGFNLTSRQDVVDIASVPAGGKVETTVTATGSGYDGSEFCLARAVTYVVENVVLSCRTTAASNIVLVAKNYTTSAYDPANGYYEFFIIKP